MLFLKAHIYLSVAVALASGGVASKFTKKLSRTCLKPELEYQIPTNNEEECSEICLQLTDCQAFYTMNSGEECHVFMFNKCGRHLNQVGCSKTNEIWILNKAGVPNGEMCPNGYGNGFSTTFYKLVPAANWLVGKQICMAEGPLGKYADAVEKAEFDHFYWMLRNRYNSTPFFVGAQLYRDDRLFAYLWTGCNGQVRQEYWRFGRMPIENRCCTALGRPGDEDIMYDIHPRDPYFEVRHALCECVDPFRL